MTMNPFVYDLICDIACWLFHEKKRDKVVFEGEYPGVVKDLKRDSRLGTLSGRCFEAVLSAQGGTMEVIFIVTHQALADASGSNLEGEWFDAHDNQLSREPWEGTAVH